MTTKNRPASGTGTHETTRDKQGGEVCHGRFRAGGRQIKRKLGFKSRDGESTGLTKAEAERAWQKLIDAYTRLTPVSERIEPQAAGDRCWCISSR